MSLNDKLRHEMKVPTRSQSTPISKMRRVRALLMVDVDLREARHIGWRGQLSKCVVFFGSLADIYGGPMYSVLVIVNVEPLFCP